MGDTHEAMRRIQRERDAEPLPKKVGDLFSGGALKPQYIEHRPATRALLIFHKIAHARAPIDPQEIGLIQARRLPLLQNQLSHRFPWAVMWIKDGKRYRKLQTNLGTAVSLRNRIRDQYGVKNVTVVSRSRPYSIPVELIGKLPKPWVWCPNCMKPRKYVRVASANGLPQTFFGYKKIWNPEKEEWVQKELKLALTCCPMCGNKNRQPTFRKSNQPFEIRHFKRGVTRARKKKRKR